MMKRTLLLAMITAFALCCKPVTIDPFVPEDNPKEEEQDPEPKSPDDPDPWIPDPQGENGEYSYSGERISFTAAQEESHSYDVEIIPIDGIGKYQGHAGQGFTCFGNIGFYFYDGGYCQTIDLVNRTIISSFELPGPVFNSLNHAGQAEFGLEYYHSDDPFPLLYLSSYLEKCCYVLRMTTTGATLVQTIYLTDGTKDENGNWNLMDAQAFFPDGEKLVIKMGGVDATGYKYKYWMVFDMPYSKFGEKLYLLEEKQTDKFYIRTIKDEWNGSSNYYNAGCALNGRLYVLAGFRGERSRLLVIDYDNHRVVTDIHWGDENITKYEQEQCCIWTDNKLLINFNGKDQLACITFGN